MTPIQSNVPPVIRRAILPGGFIVGGVACGIKASGRPDLALVVAPDGPAATAAVFTANQFVAAPVQLSRAHLTATAPDGAGAHGWSQAIVSTSGCANAATGAAGDADQLEIAGLVAAATAVPVDHVLTMSTGVIGTRLPLDRVASGLVEVVGSLGTSETHLAAAAEALRTTDSVLKVSTVTVELPADPTSGGTTTAVRVTGIAKGVGMIHPQMATMLSIVMTDATVAPVDLHAMLQRAASRTWNQLSIDGDTSTNDTVFLLASGASPSAAVERGSAAETSLAAAIEAIARDLARQQAADGEGATTLMTCQVSGAHDDADARAIARSVVSSSLVKTAVHGRDPNWGRIAAAAGNARLPSARVLLAAGLEPPKASDRAGTAATVDPTLLRIAIAGHDVFDGTVGGPLAFDRPTVRNAMDRSELLLRLDLGLGSGQGEAFGCDLTEAYVLENSEYTT